MKRRFKKSSKKNYKLLLIILIIFFSFYFMSSILFNGITFNLKDYLFNTSLNEFLSKKSLLTKFIDINITTPENMIYNAFNKVAIKSKNSIIGYDDDYFDYDKVDSEYAIDPNYKASKDPIVYIYNTHQLESYNMNTMQEYSIKPNVMIASYIMKEKLDKKGIPSIVETNNIKEYLNNNNLQYNYSYTASRYFALKKLEEHKSIKYLIDIHRDSPNIDKTLYVNNNIRYARLLFVVGLDHANYKPNLELATSLNKKIEALYPGLSRGISKKTGRGVNGIYNQDLSENAILIEIGGIDNEIEEVNNTIDVFTSVISEYIKEK